MQSLTNFNASVGAGLADQPMTWQQHMKAAIRTVPDLLRRLQLEPAELVGKFGAAAESQFPVFVPLPYLERIRPQDTADPLLRQVLPVPNEDVSSPGFSVDPLAENAATLQPGLLQKYHGRVLVVATGACAIHCRYCFRRHFPYSDTAARPQLAQQLADQLAGDLTLEEVILSGGDPLTLTDDSLFEIFDVIEAATHIKRLRIHTRLPIVIPQRVTDALAERLGNSRLQKFVVIHINHANEIDSEVADSLQRLAAANVQLLNQSVLLAGVNDSADALFELSLRLLDVGVLPYYLHQLDRVTGAAHFEVPIETGKTLIAAIRARLPGFAVPRYVQELPGEPNKTVLA